MLIKCPECGSEISDQVKICPKCGYPIKKKKGKKIIAGCAIVVALAVGLSTAAYNYKVVKPRNTYEQAVALYKSGDYTSAREVFADINGYEDVEEILLQMDTNEKYNDYIDNAIIYSYFTYGGMVRANNLLGEITSVWYNSIYEEDDWFTDEFTKDSNGSFYDDFNTAIYDYRNSNNYFTYESELNEYQQVTNDLFLELKDVPNGLENFNQKISDLQSSFTSFISTALNPEGTYSTVSQAKIDGKKNFESVYNDLISAVPKKKNIVQHIENDVAYDFRNISFGMTKYDIIKSETKNNGMDPYDTSSSFSFFADGSIGYDDSIHITESVSGTLCYYFDDSGLMNHITIKLYNEDHSSETEDVLHLLTDFQDLDNFISTNCSQYPYAHAYVRDSETHTYIDIVSYTKEEYENYGKSSAEPEIVGGKDCFMYAGELIDREYGIDSYAYTTPVQTAIAISLRRYPEYDANIVINVPTWCNCEIAGSSSSWLRIELLGIDGYEDGYTITGYVPRDSLVYSERNCDSLASAEESLTESLSETEITSTGTMTPTDEE